MHWLPNSLAVQRRRRLLLSFAGHGLDIDHPSRSRPQSGLGWSRDQLGLVGARHISQCNMQRDASSSYRWDQQLYTSISMPLAFSIAGSSAWTLLQCNLRRARHFFSYAANSTSFSCTQYRLVTPILRRCATTTTKGSYKFHQNRHTMWRDDLPLSTATRTEVVIRPTCCEINLTRKAYSAMNVMCF